MATGGFAPNNDPKMMPGFYHSFRPIPRLVGFVDMYDHKITKDGKNPVTGMYPTVTYR